METQTKEYVRIGLDPKEKLSMEEPEILLNTPALSSSNEEENNSVEPINLKETKKTIGDFLLSKKSQIAAALPSHMTPDRMLRLVMTELNRNPELKKCTLPSLIGAVLQCSQYGLEPGGILGHAYLIVYKNKKQESENKWITVPECQFQLGYRGMIELAQRSGKLKSVAIRPVYENDIFEYSYGLLEKCHHIPAMQDGGALIGVYAIIEYLNGGKYFEFIPIYKINKIRDKSQSYMTWLKYGKKGKPPIWEEYYEEMALKTGIRHVFKYLPISVELQKAISFDEAAERGQQNNSFIFDNETGEITNNNSQSKADLLAAKL